MCVLYDVQFLNSPIYWMHAWWLCSVRISGVSVGAYTHTVSLSFCPASLLEVGSYTGQGIDIIRL